MLKLKKDWNDMTEVMRTKKSEPGLLGSLIVIAWAGMIVFVLPILSLVGVFLLCAYLSVKGIIVFISWLTLDTILYSSAIIIILGVIGLVCEEYMRPKCPQCKKGRLRVNTETLEEHTMPAGSYYYGIRGYHVYEDLREITACNRCDYKKIRDYTSEGTTYV